jgi:hypothetical protein
LQKYVLERLGEIRGVPQYKRAEVGDFLTQHVEKLRRGKQSRLEVERSGIGHQGRRELETWKVEWGVENWVY